MPTVRVIVFRNRLAPLPDDDSLCQCGNLSAVEVDFDDVGGVGFPNFYSFTTASVTLAVCRRIFGRRLTETKVRPRHHLRGIRQYTRRFGKLYEGRSPTAAPLSR